MVECGGLENRFTGNPGDEGSNPSSSASFSSDKAIFIGESVPISLRFEPCEGPVPFRGTKLAFRDRGEKFSGAKGQFGPLGKIFQLL